LAGAGGIYLGTAALALAGWLIGLLVTSADGAFIKPVDLGTRYLAEGIAKLAVVALSPQLTLMSATLTAWVGSAFIALPPLLRRPARKQLRRGERWAVIGAGVLAGLVLAAQTEYAAALLLSPLLGGLGWRACTPPRCVCNGYPKVGQEACPFCQRRLAPPPLSNQAQVWLQRARVLTVGSGTLLALLGMLLHARWGAEEGAAFRDASRFGVIITVIDSAAVVLPAAVLGLVVGVRRWPVRTLATALLAGALTVVGGPWAYAGSHRGAIEEAFQRLPAAELVAACQGLPALVGLPSAEAPVCVEIGGPRYASLPAVIRDLNATDVWVWRERVAIRLGAGWDLRLGVVVVLDEASLPLPIDAQPGTSRVWGPDPAWGASPMVRYRLYDATEFDLPELLNAARLEAQPAGS
jgi:hypothetical protein